MSTETKGKPSHLASTLAILELFSDAMGPKATVRHARLFLEIALAGEMDQGAIARKIGQTATVRMVQQLGESGAYKDDEGRRREGLGLIRSEQDAGDFRLRRLTLTREGQQLAAKIMGRLEGRK